METYNKLEDLLESISQGDISANEQDKCLACMFADTYEWAKGYLSDTESHILRCLLEHALAERGIDIVINN